MYYEPSDCFIKKKKKSQMKFKLYLPKYHSVYHIMFKCIQNKKDLILLWTQLRISLKCLPNINYNMRGSPHNGVGNLISINKYYKCNFYFLCR